MVAKCSSEPHSLLWSVSSFNHHVIYRHTSPAPVSVQCSRQQDSPPAHARRLLPARRQGSVPSPKAPQDAKFADCATGSNTASSIPRQNGQASTARSVDRHLPKDAALQTSHGICTAIGWILRNRADNRTHSLGNRSVEDDRVHPHARQIHPPLTVTKHRYYSRSRAFSLTTLVGVVAPLRRAPAGTMLLFRRQGDGRYKGFHRFLCLRSGRSATVSRRTTSCPAARALLRNFRWVPSAHAAAVANRPTPRLRAAPQIAPTENTRDRCCECPSSTAKEAALPPECRVRQ